MIKEHDKLKDWIERRSKIAEEIKDLQNERKRINNNVSQWKHRIKYNK